MPSLSDLIAEHELATESQAAQAAKPGPLQIEFLLDLPGTLEGSIRFRKGDVVTDPNAWLFLRLGVAKPVDTTAKAYCQQISLTDEKLFAKYKQYVALTQGHFRVPDGTPGA